MAKEYYFPTILISLFYLFSFSSSQISSCGGYVAEATSDCTRYSTNTTMCCYLRTYSNFFWSSMCYPINTTSYLALNGRMQLGSYSYSVDCGASIGTTCGTIMTPMSYKDCSQHSLSTNTCCYISYKGDTSCVWLGTGNIGKVSYKGMDMICGSSNISFRFIYIILILFLLN